MDETKAEPVIVTKTLKVDLVVRHYVSRWEADATVRLNPHQTRTGVGVSDQDPQDALPRALADLAANLK